jgi:hypothetical protein
MEEEGETVFAAIHAHEGGLRTRPGPTRAAHLFAMPQIAGGKSAAPTAGSREVLLGEVSDRAPGGLRYPEKAAGPLKPLSERHCG